MRAALVGIVLCLVASAMGVSRAHHSFAAIYDESRSSTFRGVVREFRFLNPHPFLFIAATAQGDAAEDEHVWRGELDNRFELVQIGVTKDTFRSGDVVVASGSTARDGSRTFYLWKLERPSDGLQYEQIGGTPYLRAPARRPR